MPRFEPFSALRYATDDLAAVVAPPYDVVSDADVDALETRSEHNIVRVDVPRGDGDRYARAASTLTAWREAGVLVADDTPTLTIYRMRFTDASGPPRYRRRARGARGRRRGGGRRPAARKDDAQGLDRPAGSDAGDLGQPVPGVGTLLGEPVSPGC